MDFRNEMRRDPYARAASGRFSPTMSPAVGGASCGVRRPGVPRTGISPAVQQAIDTLPLAMVYVPAQRFVGIKDVACALEAGTIFDALDLPFAPCRTRGGAR